MNELLTSFKVIGLQVDIAESTALAKFWIDSTCLWNSSGDVRQSLQKTFPNLVVLMMVVESMAKTHQYQTGDWLG